MKVSAISFAIGPGHVEGGKEGELPVQKSSALRPQSHERLLTELNRLSAIIRAPCN